MEKKEQVYNPYLPLDCYIPDGEPHVFGDRVYVYGSHDKEGGDAFCMLDYEVFSAPVEDLTAWRSEGIAYRASQDPTHSEKYKHMYAPDVVKGNDGRYYLYYAMAGGCFTGPIHVAVSEFPQGPFVYHGCVRNADGSDYTKHITFDPAVINDDGVIRLYYGWSLAVDPMVVEQAVGQLRQQDAGRGQERQRQQEQQEQKGQSAGQSQQAFAEQLLKIQMMMFEKTEAEIRNTPEGIMGANAIELEDDMLTVKGQASRIVPGQFDAEGTSFERHAFFEASSVRKVNGLYYFIYSSQEQHELCYAISRYPDRDFCYGGVLVSNGDIGFQGRQAKDRLAMTGNNHGSIECIHGEWYVFYHRHTHKTTYSRQGCAEKIEFTEDGHIPQVEMTSCGLNGGPLQAHGTYPAVIACVLTNGCMPHVGTEALKEKIPYITHEGKERFITDISEGTVIGYRSFEIHRLTRLELTLRGDGAGCFLVKIDGEEAGRILVSSTKEWKVFGSIVMAEGTKAIYLHYQGTGCLQLKELSFL